MLVLPEVSDGFVRAKIFSIRSVLEVVWGVWQFRLPEKSETFRLLIGSTEWFDTATGIESEGDEDFYSTQDDIVSQSSSISASVTPRVSGHINSASFSTSDSLTKPVEQLPPVSTHVTSAGSENGSQIFGIQNNCLPCLNCSTSTDVKSRSSCSSPQSAKKKVSSRLSFKWREGHSNLSILSPKAILQRPITGSQVPFCPIEKKMSDCWSPLDPSTFKVRGHNYLRDKKKECGDQMGGIQSFPHQLLL